jgi:hypothetical protein
MTCEEKDPFEHLQWRLNYLADKMQEKGYYIERDLTKLPDAYTEHVVGYLNEALGWITLKNSLEELENDFEKLRGNVFDIMHQMDRIEAKLDAV